MYGKGGKEQLCAASISCRVNFNLLLFCDRMQANQTLGYWGAFFDIFFFAFLGACLCEFVFWLVGQMIYPYPVGWTVHSARGQM